MALVVITSNKILLDQFDTTLSIERYYHLEQNKTKSAEKRDECFNIC